MISIFNKIKSFLKTRYKMEIKKNWKILNLPIYPNKIYKNGLKSIYSKLIFNLVFFEKDKLLKNIFIKKFF